MIKSPAELALIRLACSITMQVYEAVWGIRLDRYLRGRRRRRERRAYACPHCGGWHLTSQPKRRR